MVKFLFPLTVFLTILASFNSVYAANIAYKISLTGPITPVSRRYISQSLNNAENINAEFLLIRVDTPGGLVSSTEKIVKNLLNSNIPTICYVAPSGARAASAGTYIVASCNIAAMAPSTTIGAAHPVSLGFGGSSKIMKEKVTNYLSAMMRAIAEKRGRNANLLIKTVRKSKAITAKEALSSGIIDLIADNQSHLLRQLNDRLIKINGKTVKLNTNDITIITREMNWKDRLLHFISFPTISYMLFLAAALGLFIELTNPGAILPGVVGTICLILFLFSSSLLPINVSGIVLILLAFALFAADLFSASHGILSIGAVASLFIGSIMLIGSPSAPGIAIPIGLIAGISIGIGLFIIFAVGKMVAIHRKPPTTGFEGMIGEIGKALTDISANGVVEVNGERWNALTEENLIKKDTDIVVIKIIRRNTIKLIVEAASENDTNLIRRDR